VIRVRSIPNFYWILLAKASASTRQRNSGIEVILAICSVAIILNEPNGESATTYLTCLIIGSSLNYCTARRQATAPIDRPHSTMLLKPRFISAFTISTAFIYEYIIPATPAVRRSRRAPGFYRGCASRRGRGRRYWIGME
jgi:hypothetical protein